MHKEAMDTKIRIKQLEIFFLKNNEPGVIGVNFNTKSVGRISFKASRMDVTASIQNAKDGLKRHLSDQGHMMMGISEYGQSVLNTDIRPSTMCNWSKFKPLPNLE